MHFQKALNSAGVMLSTMKDFFFTSFSEGMIKWRTSEETCSEPFVLNICDICWEAIKDKLFEIVVK